MRVRGGLLFVCGIMLAIFCFTRLNTGLVSSSAGAFQQPQPKLLVAAPNGGETWPINTAQAIRWASRDFTGNVKIEIARGLGAPFEGIPGLENVPNTGLACWRVTGPESMSCRLRLSAADGSGVMDESDAVFTISAPLQSITVTSPRLGDIWRTGQTQTIQWTFQRLVGTVRIELLDTNTPPRVLSLLFDGVDIVPGQKFWTVNAPRSGFYKIKISSGLDPLIFDESGVFTILVESTSEVSRMSSTKSPGGLASHGGDGPRPSPPCAGGIPSSQPLAQPTPSITVVTPNGGEVFKPDDGVNIFWSSQGVPGRVNIVLFDLSGNPQNPSMTPLFSGVDNTGFVSLSLNFRFGPSAALKVGVISADNSSIADVSDGVFTIGVPGQGRLTLLMPNGGEELKVNSQTVILWMFEGNDVGSSVRIDISTDGGISYRLLFDNVTNNTTKAWGINLQPTDNVRLRIVSKQNPLISDVSNCTFRIVP